MGSNCTVYRKSTRLLYTGRYLRAQVKQNMAGTGVLSYVYSLAKVTWDIVTYPVYLLLGGGSAPAAVRLHYKCRNSSYPRDDKIIRFNVKDEDVPWSASPSGYTPVDYTAPVVLSKPVWADPDFRGDSQPVIWNAVDGKIDRRSSTSTYQVVNNIPRNVIGRTGLCGRGLLGRWGPNHAADPVVTRWKRNDDGSQVIDEETGRPVLQFVAIERTDSGEWAIPGGMVDPGEAVSLTLKREFGEEALNTIEASEEEKAQLEQGIEDIFAHGTEIYAGYVDDPRNTDNAWMETTAYNFHDDDGTTVGRVKLQAGDDAAKVRWQDIDKDVKLYASHKDFVETAAQRLGAHW